MIAIPLPLSWFCLILSCIDVAVYFFAIHQLFLTTTTWVVCCHGLEFSKWSIEREREREEERLYAAVCGIYYCPFFSLFLRTFPPLLLFDSVCFPPVHQAWLEIFIFFDPPALLSHTPYLKRHALPRHPVSRRPIDSLIRSYTLIRAHILSLVESTIRLLHSGTVPAPALVAVHSC